MEISKDGLAFIAAHEGFVGRAYLDPVDVLTIGYGFTMRGDVFSAYWRGRYGRPLKMGDVISRSDADTILRTMISEEYGAAVNRKLPGLEQHQFDACSSTVYNLGPRALDWKWAQALKRGDVDEAARLLRNTGTTAGGRTLAGLVRRRDEEADLLLTGRYPNHGNKSISADSDIEDLQTDLVKLGYDPGPVDGVMGPKTRIAVQTFQADNPPLAVDGVAGPATRAALERALSSKTDGSPTFLVSIIRIVANLFRGSR